jgi:nucleotide-binding universal stress UspA family protein
MAARPEQATAASEQPRSGRRRQRRGAHGQRLIVGYDGSETARAAVDWAARTVSPDGELVLVYATRPLHARPDPLASTEERRRYGEALLDELYLEIDRERLAALGPTMVADADPVSALQAAAEHWHADGIVIGCNHRSRARSAIGTVTGALLEHARLPLTVVPA